MGLTLVTPPTVWPVTLAEAKEECRVLDDSENTRITGFIRSATAHVEGELELSLMTQTWKLTLDEFSDEIKLPRGPVQSVTSVQYVDADGVTQTVDAGEYGVDLTSYEQWVVRNTASTWPTTLGAVNAVSVTYVAGFDELPTDWLDLKYAVLLTVRHWFDLGELADAKSGVPPWVDALMQRFRKFTV